MSGARALSGLVYVLCAGLAALLTWLILFADPRWSVALLAGDDAGYYLAIARNACLGYGPSFDRVHPTNGFNPLLTLILIGADRLLVPDRAVLGCYRVGLMVTWVALLGGFVSYLRLVGRFVAGEGFEGDRRTLALAAAAAFYMFYIAPKKQFGMDASLVLLIGIYYLDRVVRGGLLRPSFRAAIVDGVTLGLLVLARVDMLPFLVAAFAVMAVAAGRDRRNWSAVAQRAVFTTATVLPFVVWGYRHFGTWLPVSARIKSSFPHVDLIGSLAVIRGTSVNETDQASFLVAYIAAVALLAIGLRRAGSLPARLREPRVAVMAMLALYVVMRLTYMLLFSRIDVQGGYVMLAHVLNALVLFAGLQTLARRASEAARPRWVVTAALVLLIIDSVGSFAGKLATQQAAIRDPESGNEWTLAQRIRDATQPSDVLYGGAFGLVGFFADRAWINGDGVANTYDYQRAFLREGGLREWLSASGVTHVVFASADNAGAGEQAIRLEVTGALTGRTEWIEVDPRNIVLQDQLARGMARSSAGSTVTLARYSP